MAANMECPSPNTGLQDFSFSKTQFNKKKWESPHILIQINQYQIVNIIIQKRVVHEKLNQVNQMTPGSPSITLKLFKH